MNTRRLVVPSALQKKKVSKQWNILALDGSNWQKIDLFSFQLDIEVSFI
jgi:F-box and leucine-rich repeat protein 2/20